QLRGRNSLRGSSVCYSIYETTELEDGWKHQEFDAIGYVDSQATPTLNIMRALVVHGHKFEAETTKSPKILSHPLFINAYKRAKAVLPDASFKPTRTQEGKEAFSILLNDGQTVLVDVDNGVINATFENNRSSF